MSTLAIRHIGKSYGATAFLMEFPSKLRKVNSSLSSVRQAAERVRCCVFSPVWTMRMKEAWSLQGAT